MELLPLQMIGEIKKQMISLRRHQAITLYLFVLDLAIFAGVVVMLLVLKG